MMLLTAATGLRWDAGLNDPREVLFLEILDCVIDLEDTLVLLQSSGKSEACVIRTTSSDLGAVLAKLAGDADDKFSALLRISARGGNLDLVEPSASGAV